MSDPVKFPKPGEFRLTPEQQQALRDLKEAIDRAVAIFADRMQRAAEAIADSVKRP